MKKITCALFDMDGVMLDTESQYDIFWKDAGKRYGIDIPNFEKVIKGTTLPNILKKYFSEFTKEQLDILVEEIDKFEQQMVYPEIPGSIAFVNSLKALGMKVGLVTSSGITKLKEVYKVKHFDTLFDTIVYDARITHGKPAPDCYLLAAKDLGVNPEECVVFEDSFAGIESGLAAGMTVIGLSTTHPAEKVKEKGVKEISDFTEMNYDKLLELVK
ncbi:HAD family phosphatase [Prevotella sp. 10(H)]|uniref:HAD family hydrolase n=1 Tax=Prevotella sp. 10(H) TaxID=1158294 RepID=UPI0004A72C37|nr:HAD family phosphatase [Prevotella sp. 10(H)]